MKRDTKRIERLLANTRESRKLVREEIADGSSLQHIYDDLGNHEQHFATRLVDLNQFNAQEDKKLAKSKKPEKPEKPEK